MSFTEQHRRLLVYGDLAPEPLAAIHLSRSRSALASMRLHPRSNAIRPRWPLAVCVRRSYSAPRIPRRESCPHQPSAASAYRASGERSSPQSCAESASVSYRLLPAADKLRDIGGGAGSTLASGLNFRVHLNQIEHGFSHCRGPRVRQMGANSRVGSLPPGPRAGYAGDQAVVQV